MNKHKETDSINAEKNTTNDFLFAAISNLAGNLNFLDTKISIVMAAVGVVLGLVVACKSNILRAYNYYSECCVLKVVFMLLSFVSILSMLFVFVFGIRCIMVRFGKSESPSMWFFRTVNYGGIPEQEYYQKIKQMTDKDVTNSLSSELYKLNSINDRKMRAGRAAIVSFFISCISLFFSMFMVGIAYLVV